MSISSDIMQALPGIVEVVRVDKGYEVNGETAVRVIAYLENGKEVEGTFTTSNKASFGGVQFMQQKDVAGLMVHKINSVMKGTAE